MTGKDEPMRAQEIVGYFMRTNKLGQEMGLVPVYVGETCRVEWVKATSAEASILDYLFR